MAKKLYIALFLLSFAGCSIAFAKEPLPLEKIAIEDEEVARKAAREAEAKILNVITLVGNVKCGETGIICSSTKGETKFTATVYDNCKGGATSTIDVRRSDGTIRVTEPIIDCGSGRLMDELREGERLEINCKGEGVCQSEGPNNCQYNVELYWP
ncbi:MAG: hypothetical protein SCARUB_04763 [Candidatus Scalindua rubra]|uniref:Lipoprotein n=1 Tax=Candidatus Scalindua rubra TaxID=1872076 RepID=A0A1E3X3A5_9BACT|nr:MAG: hypothetical protein SCARUB_04763 [Candidatus Scalindua rubra]